MKQILVILALVIYKATVVSIRSLKSVPVTNKVLNKCILFKCFIDPPLPKALKGYTNPIINW